ncbi:HlyC/CorC family transporter [Echinimonas agarilytica]|uniref:CNNM domain-containing protein n=1 Tax=Echinimonas agarilytica TaxID=1215918 RepID=A0AA41W7Z0_9GAMM|nr:CNNM domain-containing protein [Echinimonas agarilytica]MCM2680476.1 CNNM domain-containing protein [Echinimonas agarilytica]
MDGISTGTLLGLLFGLIFISALFSASETGMMSINRYRLRHQAKHNNPSAKRVLGMLDRPDRLLGLILIGNNLVNISASAIATIIGMRVYGDYGIAVATFVLTFFVLIFAEVTPKTFAALFPERVAFPMSFILRPLMVVFYPFVWAVNAISNGLLLLFGIRPDQNSDEHLSSEELRTVVHEAGKMIPRRHQDMLLSILDLEKVTVEDIMIPRSDIVGFDINDDWKLLSRQLVSTSHTKVLVYRDTIDDAVGFIHSRDALRLLAKGEFEKDSMLRAVRPLYYIPEGTPLNVQLLKFQRNKERIGLVVDEYGDIQGLVTLEDILEEIVGDFTTSTGPTLSDEVKPQGDGSFLVDATANIRDINKELKWDLPTDGPKTLNGLILEHLEDIPDSQITVKIGLYTIDITEVSENMVKQARITPPVKFKRLLPDLR